jgi:hypothetical protein
MGGMVQHDWPQNESSPGPLAAYGLPIYGLVREQERTSIVQPLSWSYMASGGVSRV